MTAESLPKREFQKVPLQAEIHVICGPMRSGKSAELIQVASRLPYAGYKVQVFKPDMDKNGGQNAIVSETGLQFTAVSVRFSTEILKLVKEGTDVVAIDEAQFFDPDFPEVCEVLVRGGKRVIVAGLDKDFRGEPFGPMGRIKEIADNVTMLHAFCVCCGRNATRTQRIIVNSNGEKRPANYGDPTVLIGTTELYEARCRDCHEVPGKPQIAVEEGKEITGPLAFYISGNGPEAAEVKKLLVEFGHTVFEQESDDEDSDVLEGKVGWGDGHRSGWKDKNDVAIFTPEIRLPDLPLRGTIQELKEWFDTGKPSLYIVKGNIDIAAWPSSVKYFCKRIVSLGETPDIGEILQNFLNDIRVEMKRSKNLSQPNL